MDQGTTLSALVFYFYISLLLTAIVAPAVIALYRRAVLKRMMTLAGAETIALSPREATRGESTPQLQFVEVNDRVALASEAANTLNASKRTKRRLAWIYGIAGLVVAVIFAVLQMRLSEIEYAFVSLLVLVHAAWVVPTVAIATAMPFGRALRAFVVYILAGCASVVLIPLLRRWIVEGEFDASYVNNAAWFLYACWNYLLTPLLLLLITANRKLRAVAPVVFAGLLCFAAAPFLFQKLAEGGFEHPLLRTLILNAGPTGLFLLVSIPIGYIAWRLIAWLELLYERKRFSDIHLLISAWWVVFIVQQAGELSSARGNPALVAAVSLLAIGAFLALTTFGIRFFSRSPLHGVRLLLLRVFGYQRRTERLFDAVGQNWRFAGAVQIIAGPDLAGRTIDPSDLIRFAAGRLDESFVADAPGLAARLASLDVTADPDGRYRVNEFFCHDNTWQATLVSLLERSDRVLMDLRGFSVQRAGCRFELEQLVRRADLNCVVLLVDATTDEKLLRELLDSAWLLAILNGELTRSAKLKFFRVKSDANSRLLEVLLGAHAASARI